ncbi:MAG: alpha/beta hydrolase [Chloroflexaceae bacterium]|jgi:pimeloyl-ACP methyl ester carboxylesterase|nr:alpha/beta hydrolase [Chloroflexaceae bacterium]
MSSSVGTSKYVSTSDGVRLHYLEAGSGKPLVLVPGWSQTAEQFRFQLEGLADRYRVIALDMRGHGESDKPDWGYKITRLSKDLHDVVTALDLHDVTVLGHSMGCSVIWGYLELFGNARLSKLVLVDQSPLLTSNPAWSPEELEGSGAIFTPAAVVDTCNALASPEGEAVTRGFIGGMLTGACSEEQKEWIIQRNLRMPRAHAATLLYNHCGQDWRDTISRITLPTLIVGGRVSLIPWKSQVWMQGHIPGSRLEIFEEAEGGQHFMFIEGAAKFNRLVAEFVG